MPGVEDPMVNKAATVRDLMGLYYATPEETDITNNTLKSTLLHREALQRIWSFYYKNLETHEGF